MPVEKTGAAGGDRARSTAATASEARAIVRTAAHAALATLDLATGTPYASLVLVAAHPDGRPVLLLSALAAHTRNARADPRASLLCSASEAAADPLAGARVTLTGRLAESHADADRDLFLARHAGAARYADFPDFGFFRLELSGAHFIGGFGRIVTLTAADLRATL